MTLAPIQSKSITQSIQSVHSNLLQKVWPLLQSKKSVQSKSKSITQSIQTVHSHLLQRLMWCDFDSPHDIVAFAMLVAILSEYWTFSSYSELCALWLVLSVARLVDIDFQRLKLIWNGQMDNRNGWQYSVLDDKPWLWWFAKGQHPQKNTVFSGNFPQMLDRPPLLGTRVSKENIRFSLHYRPLRAFLVFTKMFTFLVNFFFWE